MPVMIPVFKPCLNDQEVQAVEKVLKSGWIGNGPKTKEFENKFLAYVGGKYGVALNSASAAVHLAFVVSNLKEGDEVITPSFTFVATNHPILMQKAIPVFCDIDEKTLTADPKDIERKITNRTKIIIVVHYGGHPVDLDPIIKLCQEKNILLIEDCAHASGSFYKGKHVGSFGDFSCFSFAAIKNLTTGDGGMLIGKNKKRIEYARCLAWSGISQSTWERAKKRKLKWKYNIKSIGWKYQMNDISASLGLVQLEKLTDNNRKRKKIFEAYSELLRDIKWLKLPVIKDYAQSSYHNYPIRVSNAFRDKMSSYLADKGISTTVHYLPTHHYKLYTKYKSKLPVTEKVWREILLLPIYPDLSFQDVQYVASKIKKFKP